MLPEVRKVPLELSIFPKPFQTVIFRNYGMVATERIARVLSCDVKTVEEEAARLGLAEVSYDSRWETRGFITIIRDNWYLLPYDQLLTLLDYDEHKLDFALKNEDFLFVKLGFFKPLCPTVTYEPLSSAEKRETERLATRIAPRVAAGARPFTFFCDTGDTTPLPIAPTDGIRLIHGYLSLCGDAFVEDSERYFPDSLFLEYQKNGINAVWLHGVLAALSPYPFDETQSVGYELRRKNLSILVERAARYGIKVFLYLNEPRGLPEEKLGKNAHLAGRRADGIASLCFEKDEVRDYLYTATKDLLTAVPGLGGFITITMSESVTHCNSMAKESCNCETCRNISAEVSASSVNNVIMKAVRDAKTGAKVLAFLWGWSEHMGWTEEQVAHGISLLDPEIITVVTSEYGRTTNIGGVEGKVVDYSIANYGPSPLARLSYRESKKRGGRTAAKIQVNNSWECSATPYMPVFDLLYRHLVALDEVGVNDYMLTWTLGGYPSPMLDLVRAFAESPKGFSLDAWYEAHYGKDAETVHAAVLSFSEGLSEYPHSIRPLYDGPKTRGAANLWSLSPSGNESTMVCYTFDDYEKWIDPYPYDVYISQYEKLVAAWEKGLRILEGASDAPAIAELRICAEASYVHFKADLLHTRFSHDKRDPVLCRDSLLSLLSEERRVVEHNLSLWQKCPAVGYEASNHYFYNDRNLIEKLLGTEKIEAELKALSSD